MQKPMIDVFIRRVWGVGVPEPRDMPIVNHAKIRYEKNAT